MNINLRYISSFSVVLLFIFVTGFLFNVDHKTQDTIYMYYQRKLVEIDNVLTSPIMQKDQSDRFIASEPTTTGNSDTTRANEADYNEGIRNKDYFIREVEELVFQNNQRSTSEQSKADFYIQQNTLLFDYELGPTHPARSEFIQAAKFLFEVRDSISKQLMDGSIDGDQAQKALAQSVDSFRRRCIDLFSDADYEKIFHTRKTGDLAGSLGLHL